MHIYQPGHIVGVKFVSCLSSLCPLPLGWFKKSFVSTNLSLLLDWGDSNSIIFSPAQNSVGLKQQFQCSVARLVFTKLQYATFSFCFSYVHFLCLLVQQRSSGQSICCYMKSPFYESIKNIKYERVQQRSHKPILCLTPSANCTKLGTEDSGNICISLPCGHSPAPLSFRQVPVGEN